MFRKVQLSFLRTLGIEPTISPIAEVANAKPIVASAKPVTPPTLEPGPYALKDYAGNIFVDGISLNEVMRIAPSIAKTNHCTVIPIIPLSRRPKPAKKARYTKKATSRA